jgi:hypothetical protein
VTIGTLASANLGLLPLAGGTMTGVLAVTAGTAALPGIAVSGDTNTGIYSPGADQVAISTGGTSRLAVSTTAVSSTLAIDHPLGAVGTPSITFTGDLNTGLFSPGADTLALVTGGTQRATIASNGAVGVGDTSPASNTLRASFRGPVNGTESALPVVSIVRTNNIAGGTGVAETGLDVQIPYTFNGAGEVKGINVFTKHNVGTSATYGIFAEAGGNPSYGNIYSGYFKVTQPDTNGAAVNYAVYAQANSTIGVSSSGYSIGVTSETNNYVNNQNFRAVSLYTGASTQTVLSIIRNTSAIGSITTSTTATAYNTSSDYRLKENLVPLTGAIDRLQQIPVHRFNFIADPDRTVDGFIAHETQAVVPEAVHGTKDEVDNEGNPVYQGIDQSKLVPLLTAALQEAIAKIEALETRLSALEAA